MADQNKLGLYKKMKIDKVAKELEEIQSAGKESILLIAERLEKELLDQGYGKEAMVTIWHHEGYSLSVDLGKISIRRNKQC